MDRGQPRKFKNGKQLLNLWEEFCNEIIEKEFISVPTFIQFRKWLLPRMNGMDSKTIYNSINKYFPDIKKDIEIIRSDTVAQGTMLGKYQPAMSIFGLKNWCGWTDKAETTTNTTITIETDPLSKALEDLANGDK